MADAAADANGRPKADPAFVAPQISLPKGGGALRSIGETFKTNSATGTGTLSVPIAASPGRGGFGPQLALAYDSGVGNGPFGMGWHLALPNITRRTDKGLPRYEDAVQTAQSDIFLLAGTEDLVPMLPGWGEALPVVQDEYEVQSYRPRTEGLFAQIERWTCRDTGETHWRSITRDNVLSLYGLDEASRIADPEDKARVFTWLICRSHDDKGNAIIYEYASENDENVDLARASERNRSRGANRYIKRISYGNRAPLLLDPMRPGMRGSPLAPPGLEQADWMFSLVFDYGEGHIEGKRVSYVPRHGWAVRPDAVSSFRSGFEVRTYRLCRQALMFHHFPEELGVPDYLVKATRFAYDEREFGSCLSRVVQAGYEQLADGAYVSSTLPALELTYVPNPLEHPGAQNFAAVDVPASSLENLPGGVDGTAYRWLDVDGEGIAGILADQSGAWLYKHNLGDGRFGAMQTMRAEPVAAQQRTRQQHLMDVAGAGLLDLVELGGPAPGFYGRTPEAGWEGFRPFVECPLLDWNDANLRFVDLTGDGTADVLITEDDAYCWYPSLLEDGYGRGVRVKIPLGEEESGPRAIFSDPEQSIYLADMTGDGLADILRIRNGEVCYWPNCGYGKFGAKITMDDAPWFDAADLFDRRRLRLADTDGTGTADILYLAADGVRVYLNRAGNRLSEARVISGFPAIDNLAAVDVADLLGRGTACIVWSSPLPRENGRQLRYIDVMCGVKPHLLARVDNHMGAVTQIEYASSTEFYLADKLAGTPWLTKLPFPVHVVKRVEVYDAVSRNRMVTRFSYHHGFYDGLEREFRGFGRVEQLDTEDFASFRARAAEASHWDEAYNVPPVLTKTWFHTGVFLHGGKVARHMAHEYFAPDHAVVLNDTILPDGLTPFEAREACRALKGALLRTEIYALDGTENAAIPYSAMESNFTIVPVQPKDGNRYAVFFMHQRETLSAHYERDADDPRLDHEVVLAVDAYGNVLRHVAIGYARRVPEFSEQAKLLATLEETDYTNAVLLAAAYRPPAVAAARHYELTAPPLRGAEVLPFAVIAKIAYEAQEISYTAVPEGGRAEKRFLAESFTQYRRDDLAGLLPQGALEALALPGAVTQRALTDGLLDLFAAKAEAHELREILAHHSSGYRDVAGSGPFFAGSGLVFYNEAHTAPAQELAFAAKNFFLPHRFRDVFEHDSEIGYDAHRLAPVISRDAAGNETRAVLDYRVLQTHCLTDANGNRSQARFDVVGMLSGTALMGKAEGPAEGDSFEDFCAVLTQREIDEYFASPAPAALARKHLGTATSRFIYDWHRVPACSAAIARETHVSDLAAGETTRVQLQFAYSDGFGRTAQTKLQAEPGPLRLDEPQGAVANPRWVASAAKLYNNKGNAVREYEPFFSATPHFGIERWGVSRVLFYDPPGRVTATLHPDHSFEKIEFTSWKSLNFDGSDTVNFDPLADVLLGPFFRLLPEADYLPSWYEARINGALGPYEKKAAEKAALCANTPNVSHFDVLGRSFLSIADNGAGQKFATRSVLDIQGQVHAVIDALGRTVVRNEYDMRGLALRQHSMESGERWMLNDALGKPMRRWDSRGYRMRHEYDVLHRPLRNFVQGGHENEQHFAHEILFERIIYGDAAESGLSAAAQREYNLRGKMFRHFDQAGMVETGRHDFKGNSLTNERRFTISFQDAPDWAKMPRLEPEVYAGRSEYDALNRVVLRAAPDGSLYRPRYNDASLLLAVEVNVRGVRAAFEGERVWQSLVEYINYDARGQRSIIRYGNGVHTRYAYDEKTQRLVNLHTRRHSQHGTHLFADTACVQDLYYVYDPVGNILCIEDAAQRTVFHANHAVKPVSEFTYDPLYRLIAATGREHAGQSAFSFAPPDGDYRDFPFVGPARTHDLQALRHYTERYEYDAAGNVLAMRHQAAQGNWERDYGYEAPSLLEPWRCSNRLSWTAAQEKTWALRERYSYDAHGNITQMPHLPRMDWDFHDQLRCTSRQIVNEGTAEATWYVYDASGQRVRKISVRADGTRRNERRYVGSFEVYREFDRQDGVERERETLGITDDKQRIVLIETLTVTERRAVETPRPVLRYQLANHLGSSCVELDEAGGLISYEEYGPFGSASFQTRDAGEVSGKRYRYCGKERDDESGFYYYGARYYAPWLGRWSACDPIGIKSGVNSYDYVKNNPVRLMDPDGRDWRDSLSWTQRAALWLDDKVNESPVAKGIVDNLDKRGEALVKAPGAIADLYHKEGATGVGKAMVTGVGHLVKDTGEALGDITYEAVHYDGDKSKQKIASRMTDVVLNTADIVTLVDGAGGIKNMAVGGAKGAVAVSRSVATTFKEGAEVLKDGLQGGRLVPATGVMASGGKTAVATGGRLALDAADAVKSTRALAVGAKNATGGAKPKPKPPEPPPETADLKPYDKPGGGHHTPAKSAFKGAPGYDMFDALAIPNEELARLGIRHADITAAQASAYRAFAKTGAKLTWADLQRIEAGALVKAGMKPGMAEATVSKAIQALKDQGVAGPTRIPWSK